MNARSNWSTVNWMHKNCLNKNPNARQAFAALVGEFGDDPLAMFHPGGLKSGEPGTEIEFHNK
jgi:hypothetical protein